MSILDKYEVKELNDPESLALLKPFKGHNSLLKLTPGDWVYLPGYKKFADEYNQFEVTNSESSQDNNNSPFCFYCIWNTWCIFSIVVILSAFNTNNKSMHIDICVQLSPNHKCVSVLQRRRGCLDDAQGRHHLGAGNRLDDEEQSGLGAREIFNSVTS